MIQDSTPIAPATSLLAAPLARRSALALGATAALAAAFGATAAAKPPSHRVAQRRRATSDSHRLPADTQARIDKASAWARGQGADIGIAVADRTHHQTLDNGNHGRFETASVSKLFIADYVIHRSENGGPSYSVPQLQSMLRSSNDFAAQGFWDANGGASTILPDVARRYGLDIGAPYDGAWWNTQVTTTTLVAYYRGLLAGSGGLSTGGQRTIVSNLRASTPLGTDGTDQTFGLRTALTHQKGAGYKMGWMPIHGNTWEYLSTGIFGPTNQFIVVLAERAPGAGSTSILTEVARQLFPAGFVGTPQLASGGDTSPGLVMVVT